MKTPVDELKLVSMVIHEEGFKLVESKIVAQAKGFDSLTYVTGNAFMDGRAQGFVDGIKHALSIIYALRKETREMEK